MATRKIVSAVIVLVVAAVLYIFVMLHPGDLNVIEITVTKEAKCLGYVFQNDERPFRVFIYIFAIDIGNPEKANIDSFILNTQKGKYPHECKIRVGVDNGSIEVACGEKKTRYSTRAADSIGKVRTESLICLTENKFKQPIGDGLKTIATYSIDYDGENGQVVTREYVFKVQVCDNQGY